MTEEEYEQLKDGDYVDLTCRVIHMEGAKNFPTLIVGDQLVTLTRGLMKAWATPSEKYVPRRKFKRHDLVDFGGKRYVLQEDENEFGNVLIEHPDLYIGARELTLLMPAGEIEALTAWEGGRND